MKIVKLHDVMPDSQIPKFFKKATGRKYTNKETCVNDIRRMLMLFWNERASQPIDPPDQTTSGCSSAGANSVHSGGCTA